MKSRSDDKSQSEAHLRSHVQILAGVIGERNSRHPSALEATRAYITKQLTDLNLQVIEHRYNVPGRRAMNLEVVFNGIKPACPSLLVGAHYDTAPNTPGADDNASAVAALLEIIKNLQDRKLKRTLWCIFFDCEEPPHFATRQMGSFYDAELRKEHGEVLHGMICLESIGYFPRKVDNRVYRPKFIHRIDQILGGRTIVIVSDLQSIGFGLPFLLRFLTAGFFRCVPAALPRSVGIIDLSDHRSYWKHGYRALMVTNTAMFRNPNYHQPTDLPDTLDYHRLAKLTKMLTSAIRRTCG